MNRRRCMVQAMMATVPRTRGDEPAAVRLKRALIVCSPHARG